MSNKPQKKELYNLRYLIKSVVNASFGYAIASFIQPALEAAIPFVLILLPKYIIDELMGRKRMQMLCFYVVFALGIVLVLSVISNALKRYMKAEMRNILVRFEADIGSHNMDVAYVNLEDTKYIELKDRAMLPIRERMTLLYMIRYIPDMIQYAFAALVSIGIFIKFDVISLVVILIPMILITKSNQKYQKSDIEMQRESVKVSRPFMYYYNLMSDFGAGKDIRLFKLNDLLMKRNNECDDMALAMRKKRDSIRYAYEGKVKVLEGLRSSFIYAYIGMKSLMLNTGIGNFTLYIGAANKFSTSISKLMEDIVWLRQDLRYLEDYVKLQEMPTEKEIGGISNVDSDDILIEFKDVSFRYPGSEINVLNGVSFCLNSRESISIVGRNGAGKTTIIKLLARLFHPSEGKILINGIDIQSIDSETYKKLISVVFQDFKMFQFSIADNITIGEKINEERLKYSLETAGIMDKINTLENGMNTYVGKQLGKTGTEFSGGELQKLAIARSIYKDAPVIVLDEPTAALDPYAEEEIYERFHKLTNGRSTVYISHRLSSCKFCDRILFLENGKIIEDGNHAELMKRNGKYAEMFTLQASQYIA